jgi:hypothetical protein
VTDWRIVLRRLVCCRLGRHLDAIDWTTGRLFVRCWVCQRVSVGLAVSGPRPAVRYRKLLRFRRRLQAAA